MEKVVLAYSGGLDTSCILKWLLEKNYEVICYMANVGQDEDFEAAHQKALNIGASKVIVDDLRKQFVDEYIWPAIASGVIYESRYLLGTSLARPCISEGLIRCVIDNDAKYIAHGATGKGNDQVRFELACFYLLPSIKVIAPWRDKEFCGKFQGRQDLIKYASKHNIPVVVTSNAPWSMDANLMHVSYESGILEDPNTSPPSGLFTMTRHPLEAPQTPLPLTIEFVKGVPVQLLYNEKKIIDSLEIFITLNNLGSLYGIGRIDIVENRFIGLKSRGIYETPAGHILHAAHTDLEAFCLDKEVYRLKQYLRDKLSDAIYNGFWFSPEGAYLRRCIALAMENVTGSVRLELLPATVNILGRQSPHSTYNQRLVSMDVHGGFNPEDATGFINIQAMRLKEYRRLNLK